MGSRPNGDEHPAYTLLPFLPLTKDASSLCAHRTQIMQPITRSRGVTHAAAMRAVAVIALATYSLNNLKFEVFSFSRFRDISGDVKF